MKLTIVIPALNEEASIGSIIERTLAARETIASHSPVDDVEVVVVSDGSTDRTAEIAAGYRDVRLIVFEQNQGYGAAIKRGFSEGTGDLVGFLDADGTCDPAFFAQLCTALIEEGAAVALGSRMGPESHMPRVRRLGNRIYALILSTLSNRVVTDTASGMRVLRRDVLPYLYPLPDGLHFTPALSARVLMDDHLKLVERPMPYEERIGQSKLNVLKDGLRFFHTIFEMTLVWNPARLFLVGAIGSLLVMVLLAMHPVEVWLRLGQLDEDMIYRLLACWMLGTLGASSLSAAVVSDHLCHLLDPTLAKPRSFAWTLLDRVYTLRGVALFLVPCAPLMVWMVGSGVWTWLSAGYVALHWSRVVFAGLMLFAVVELFVATLIVNVLRFHVSRRRTARFDAAATRRKVGAIAFPASESPACTVCQPKRSLRQAVHVAEVRY